MVVTVNPGAARRLGMQCRKPTLRIDGPVVQTADGLWRVYTAPGGGLCILASEIWRVEIESDDPRCQLARDMVADAGIPDLDVCPPPARKEVRDCMRLAA